MLKINGTNGKIMPTYTVKDEKTNQTQEMICSWQSLENHLNENPNLKQVLSAPKIVSGVSGNRDTKVPEGFKDMQRQIKKGSGKGNTINV